MILPSADQCPQPLLRRWRMGNADATVADRDNRLYFQRLAMPIKNLGDQGNAPLRRHIRKAHQARMRDLSHVDKLSEVGVYCYQNSADGGSVFQ